MAAELVQYYSSQLGDLGHRPHTEVIAHVNNMHEQTLRRRAELGISTEAQDLLEEKQLLIKMQEARDQLETRGAQQRLREVRTNIYTADQESIRQHALTPEQIAARRLSKFSQLDIASDMDNTITDMSKGDYLIDNIPASKFAELHLAQNGRSSFPTAFVQHWQPHLRSHPILFYEGGRSKDVVIRKGVDAFADHARQKRWSMQVISANFEPFVHGVLSKTKLRNMLSRVHAIKADNINATDKATVLQAEAVENPQAGRFFVGDGSSDQDAIAAHEYVIAYFALENSSFAKDLEKARKEGKPIIYFTYRTFEDIQLKLDEIEQLAYPAKAS